MAFPTIYLGKPGDMRPLPIPDTGWSVGDKRYAALTRSLNGTGTETLFGIKKVFEFDLPYTTPEDRAWLEMCYSGAVRPLYLINPLVPNRFPVSVAVTGGTARGAKDFSNTGGAVTVVPEPDLSPFSVKLAGGTALTHNGILVRPGETLTVTIRLHATATVTPKLSVLNAAGSQLTSVNGTTVAAGLGFTTSTTTVTAPDGAATATFSLTTASAADIVSNGWLATTDGSTTWTAGGGAVKVAFTDLSSQSPQYPFSTLSVTLEQL